MAAVIQGAALKLQAMEHTAMTDAIGQSPEIAGKGSKLNDDGTIWRKGANGRDMRFFFSRHHINALALLQPYVEKNVYTQHIHTAWQLHIQPPSPDGEPFTVKLPEMPVNPSMARLLQEAEWAIRTRTADYPQWADVTLTGEES